MPRRHPRIRRSRRGSSWIESGRDDPHRLTNACFPDPSLVRPGCTFLTAALRRSRGHVVGTRLFPSADVDDHDLRAVLEEYFALEDITVDVCETVEVWEPGGQWPKGCSSIMLARAYRTL
jgi:hypothetical protein